MLKGFSAPPFPSQKQALLIGQRHLICGGQYNKMHFSPLGGTYKHADLTNLLVPNAPISLLIYLGTLFNRGTQTVFKTVFWHIIDRMSSRQPFPTAYSLVPGQKLSRDIKQNGYQGYVLFRG